MRRILAVGIILFLTSLPSLAQFVAQDPTYYIPNARVLGLGKAYVALADDTGAMYTNPAGMADAQSWQFSSMSGKFLDEYTYLSASGFYPTEFGVIGLAFAGTSVAGALATTIEGSSDPADPVYKFDYSQPEMGNYNNALVLSYANFLSFLPKASFGLNLKIFSAALYGDGIVGGNASGSDLDLGLKLQPRSWLNLGLAVQNLLPPEMGGKLTYASGHEESYPTIVELGSAVNLLGRESSLLRLGENDLKVAFDINYRPSLTAYPLIVHTGLEWKPIPMLSVRAGIDQDAISDGKGGLSVVSDSTYGVGLMLGGFRFDYAYHGFAAAPSVDSHFFSLAYGFTPPRKELKDKFIIDEPADQLITSESTIKVLGNVLDPRIRKFRVNAASVKFGLKGEFRTAVALKEGKNSISFEALDNGDRLIQMKKLRALKLQNYPDVFSRYWVAKPISLLGMANIVSGYPDGTFRPEGSITRAEMCALLMKARPYVSGLQAPLEFNDLQTNHWAASFIAQAAELGVVKGYADGAFQPAKSITRAEGLSMVARFAGISEEAYYNQFKDIAPDHWAAGTIAGASRAGLIDYLTGFEFEPNRALTRAETVEMLYRTEYVQTLLKKDLLNWEGY